MPLALSILIIIVAYFIIWSAISIFSSKGADHLTFFSGNRKIPWPLVAIAMIGAPITGVTFISVPGMVINKGFSYVQMGLGFIVGYFIIAFILIPIYYKLNIISVYGFLQKRFGNTSYKTGAWLFFISKILGISIRFLVICVMLQLLVFDSLQIPYIFSVLTALGLVWITTLKGGVKSVIWGDVLKSLCLLVTIILCIYLIIKNLDFNGGELFNYLKNDASTRILYLDDPMDSKFFWKQFIAGIFIVIAMTGLDQDMMQRSLACKNFKASQKNLIVSTFLQFFVTSLLLVLGMIMLLFLKTKHIPIPDKTDNLFATVAFHESMPFILGLLFIIGIVSATLSSVASALTSMTTTMTIDILEADKQNSTYLLDKRRKYIHSLIAFLMAILVIFFFYLNEDDAISTVYKLISYTDGPILGLFIFGIFTKRQINERLLPVICLAAPILSWLIQYYARYFFMYETSFELLLINAFLTISGLYLISSRKQTYLNKSTLEVSADNESDNK